MDHRLSTFSRAFSLVELLVVIGIITILIALAVVGFKVVGRASRAKVTNNQLDNCKSLLAEYELTSTADSLLNPAPFATDHWTAPAAGTATSMNCTIAAVPGVFPLPGEAVSDPKLDVQLQDTARVIARLRAVPKNRASLEKMSADRIKAQPFADFKNTAGADLPAGQAVVLLDGNGFPILFVPGGGLTGVNLVYKGGGDMTDPANYDKANQTIRSPDGRPFWVSPGPDGNLSTGDDNIYSFGQ